MKFLTIIFALLVSSLSVQAQSQYESGMQKAFSLWGENKTNEASALFERIAQAEKENWLPSYYAANTLIVATFQTKDKTAVNEMLEKAKEFIEQAHERSPDNSEIYTLEGLLYTGYVAMEPETYGMKYSGKIMQLHGKAIGLDGDNPRAQLNSIEYEIGSARFFKADLAPFCEKLEAVRPLFQNQKSDNPFAPKYGEERIDQIKKELNCQ